MFRQIIGVMAVSTGLLVLWVTPSEAHLRDYLFNQGYYTAKRGEVELETYNDVNFKKADNSDTYSSKHQLELEYGLTDHLQVAGYLVWGWKAHQEVFYDQWKAEVKYRLREAGELPVDLAFYLEYINQNGSPPGDSDKMEYKLILAKDVGPVNFTANLIAEKLVQNATPTKFSWTAGVVYPWTPRFKTGLEIKETVGNSNEFGWRLRDHSVQLMPTIGWSPTPNTKILIGPAFGLTKAADDLQLRTMVAIEF